MAFLPELVDLLDHSHSPYHVVRNLRQKLLANGFVELSEKEEWDVQPGMNAFVERNGSSLIAFRIPKERESVGFRLTLTHTDSPTFKVKPDPIIETVDGVLLNVEPYGGMIDSTWMDRPLTIAGRVILRKGNRIVPVLLDIDKDLLVIPNLCIHMNRTVNEGMKFNAAKDMLPLIGTRKFDFPEFLAENIGASKEEILAFDLFLANRDKARVVGREEEYLSSPRLDDLASCYASLKGFLDSRGGQTAIFAAFDNEEVGSRTFQGAESTFLKEVLRRLCRKTGTCFESEIASSFALSIDNAHANHPNYPEISDRTTKVLLGKGIAIKHSARQSYTTDALTCALVKALCQDKGIPFQEYTDRSDLRGGSTLGNLSIAEVSIHSCDIGIPQLAMHSANELCAIEDIENMTRLVQAFYLEKMKMADEGILLGNPDCN